MHKNSNINNNQAWIEVPSFINNGSDIKQQTKRTSSHLGDYEDTRSFVRDVNSSLAKQVQEDMARPSSSNRRKRKKKKKPSKIMKYILFTLLSLTALCCLLLFTPGGRKFIIGIATEYIYHNLDYRESQEVNGDNVDGAFKDKLVNILLIGVEEFGNARNTDSMIIATMNTEDHSLKLTSLMRDLYVDIPGHDKNRLNAAYSLGGIDLLSNTIEQNLGVTIDGYCLVNFDQFEKIVDMVGGVSITLTSKEAQYLNTTNYISNPKYRNVKEGTQILNGNQALGYCRIRKRPTATESNDFGRTQRHRIVLNAIFDKVKNKNVVEQVLLMNKVLSVMKIETNITKKEFNSYLEEASNLKVKSLDTFRIPTDDNYENAKVTIGSRANREVLRPKDWDKMRADLNAFINGDTTEAPTEVPTEVPSAN